jgi:hypothetical protein
MSSNEPPDVSISSFTNMEAAIDAHKEDGVAEFCWIAFNNLTITVFIDTRMKPFIIN